MSQCLPNQALPSTPPHGIFFLFVCIPKTSPDDQLPSKPTSRRCVKKPRLPHLPPPTPASLFSGRPHQRAHRQPCLLTGAKGRSPRPAAAAEAHQSFCERDTNGQGHLISLRSPEKARGESATELVPYN